MSEAAHRRMTAAEFYGWLLGIDCGTPDDDATEADLPTMVMEILSPTTRVFDRNDKLEEYKTVASLEYIVLVDPDFPRVRRDFREADRAWSSNRVAGIDGVLDLPFFDLRLPLSAWYAGVTFRPRPAPVAPEDVASILDI